MAPKIKNLIVVAFCMGTLLLSAAPVFQPDVKLYQPGKSSFSVTGLPIFHEDQRQCEIGAKEIPGAGKIVKGINGISGKGIYLANAESPEGKQLIKDFKLDVPAQKQGYAIAAKDGRIAIVGRDPVGTLYGAVTLRQMIENGKVTDAVVRDWPDFAFRGGMSYCRGLARFAVGEKDREAAYKAGIDELLRHKINIIYDFDFINWGSANIKLGSKPMKQHARICRYAEERGMYLDLVGSTALWHRYCHPEGITPKNWPCIFDGRSWSDHYHCWADDKETEGAAERYAEYIHNMGMTRPIVMIHPVDGGFIDDPENWSKRCAKCRARWKDDERWKATVNQLTIWNRVLKKHFPDAIVGSAVYVYQISLLARPEEKRSPIFKQNVTAFWEKISAGISDRKFFFESWMAAPFLLKPYRKMVGDRCIHLTDHYSQPAGIFTTMHRQAASCWEPRNDNFFLTTSTDVFGRWESLCLVAEHTWNRNAPGSKVYDGGTYYDGVKDHIGPAVIMEKTLPRICHTFWGSEMAPFMTKIMASGIAPGYIENPAGTILYWNRVRRNPLYDPTVKTKTVIAGKMKTVSDSPELMKRQVDAALIVTEQLNQAKKHLDSLDRYKRKYFMYFAKRAPFWLAAARAQYNIRIGNRLIAEGKNAEAVDWLKKAGKQFDSDYDAAEKNLKELRKESDTEYPFRWKLTRQVMRKILDAATVSASVVLKPRRIGRYIRVGITTNGKDSARGIKEYLDDFSNVKTVLIDNISLAELDKYDCVILTSGSYDKDEFFRNIPAYVEKGGGGVFLEGTLCGSSRFDKRTAFPEIVRSSNGRVDNFSRKLFKSDKTQFRSMYIDYFACVPGKKGEVTVRAENGDAVVVRGQAGIGKAVFSATFNIASKNNSYDAKYEKLSGANAEIVRDAIEYFTNLKLQEKNQ